MKNYKTSLIAAKSFLQYCKDRAMYAFIGGAGSWGSPDVAPSGIQDSQYNLTNDFNDLVFAKAITEPNFSIVVRRTPWEERIFDQWLDDDPMIAEKDFYCLSSTNNVYKCISNNNAAVSTVEPSGVSTARFETADGYVWRYLYSISNDDMLRFSTPDWIPVQLIFASVEGFENQYASQVAAIPGTIDRIDVIQPGSKYGPGTTATIVGDGTGATASLTIHPVSGAIQHIAVTGLGSAYSWAEVIINDPQAIPGTGCFAKAVISPTFGHGFNPMEELFASAVIINCEITGTEGGLIRGDLTHRKFLVVADPQLTNDDFATDYRYDNTERVVVSGVSGTFQKGERVSFSGGGTGVVVYVEPTNLYLSSVNGVPAGTITGETSSANANITSYTPEKFKISGTVVGRHYFNPITKESGNNIVGKPLFRF